MKIVSLCNACEHCPVVKIEEDRVEIGEPGNLVVLKKEEWESLKEKILSGQV